jgi:alpha-1,3-fucosyltransferase 10
MLPDLGADAVLYHGPDLCIHTILEPSNVQRGFHKQLAAMVTMESAYYYSCFNDPLFMSQFDIEVSYRREVRASLPEPR